MTDNTITIGDALRLTGPAAFNIMLKPAGSSCNLECRYCYYLDKAGLYGGREPVMSEQMLETVVREYISANEVPEVTFNWHGGEPLLLGMDFYRKALALEEKYADGKTIHNTIQTNGILLDRPWAEFFRQHHFLVGISIDGPQDIHDKYRKDKGGAPSFDKVMRAVTLLQSSGVAFNTLSTINKASEGRGLEVYRFLKSIGSRYMQFMPVVEHVKDGRIVDPAQAGAQLASWSVSALGFGRFLCDIFDEWVRGDVSRYFVGQFDAALASWCGVPPGICAFSETCGGNAVIEHNGDVYPCDHFVYPQYRLGNIAQRSIPEMMASEAQIRFGIDKRNALPQACLKCRWRFAYNGECPKHRFNRTERGETGLSALCRGYQLFYSHIAPYMEVMKDLLSRGCSPAGVIPWARTRGR
ncbi:MAG: anaerobic sulfatase-maturation protein [Bacteroidales bacterium]|nr:anaerobic sulfatase-maturation protein [Bacteroidales bacterium]